MSSYLDWFVDSYIGVTGFMSAAEVRTALEAFPETNSRLLMVGVLASKKSILGIPMKPRWAKQTPPLADIQNIFIDHPRVLNLVHLSIEKEDESRLLEFMTTIRYQAGPHFHGFQLNATWPNPDILAAYRGIYGHADRIVLQVGREAMDEDINLEKAAERLQEYVPFVNDFLFDASGGLGKPIDATSAQRFLEEAPWSALIRHGIAGGLGPDTLNLIEPLIKEFQGDFNIDAQGKLRDTENNLDMNAVVRYIKTAATLLT